MALSHLITRVLISETNPFDVNNQLEKIASDHAIAFAIWLIKNHGELTLRDKGTQEVMIPILEKQYKKYNPAT